MPTSGTIGKAEGQGSHAETAAVRVPALLLLALGVSTGTSGRGRLAKGLAEPGSGSRTGGEGRGSRAAFCTRGHRSETSSAHCYKLRGLRHSNKLRHRILNQPQLKAGFEKPSLRLRELFLQSGLAELCSY